MDSLDRQMQILKMLPRRGRIATTDILSRLKSHYSIETTLRTIQRDLQKLSLKYSLVCDGKRPAGWSWSKDAIALDLPAMDPLAALTLRLVRDSMKRLLPRAALSSLNSYFRTADERLKNLSDSKLSHWPDKVRIVPRSLSLETPEIDESVLDLVYEALQQDLRFEVVYQKKPGSEKKYEVNPLGLVFVDNLMYLVATLQKYDDPVQLLIHRMKSVKLLETKSTTPEGFSLQGYIDSGEFGYPLGGTIELKALFAEHAAKHLHESKLTATQKLTEKPDGRVLLEATVRDDVQLRWWLKGFGDKVEVVGPIGLRKEFIEMAQNLLNSYGQNPQ